MSESHESMRRLKLKIAIAAPLLCTSIFVPQSEAQQSAGFSPAHMDSVLYGVAYYPEYMPTNRLDTDVDLMQKAGITVVRVGESTWSSWEPRDGEFQFAWMQRVLDRLHDAHIKVILGTPTYSIPVWLYKEHPEILVAHLDGLAPPLFSPYLPTYPGASPPGEYGVRQNYDFLNPDFRRAAERVIREIVSHFKDHPAVIGYQIDNETFPTGVSTKYTQTAFLERLKRKFKTTDAMNKAWGFVYWGQLVDTWDELPPRDSVLNPGYKLEWENFQHDIVTDYLAWQAKIVNEYKRPDQFITHDFSGGVHTNLDQWAIAKNLDVVSTNIYFATQDEFAPNEMWLSGDLARSLKGTNYLVTETNAQSIGWDSRTQYPFYPGQLRLAVYTDLAAGANMVEYWHWSSLHYGQETYWRGVLSHDLQPNRTYAEVTRIAGELKRLGPQLVNLKPDNKVAILFSADSANALSYMRFSDHVSYMTVLRQMYNALCSLNIEPDFVPAGDEKLRNYKVLLVPPLYSASDASLQQISDYVRDGGHVLMSFKSGFTNEYSTVRDTMAPGPLREAAGFHYQEFSNLAAPQKLTPDAFHTADQNMASVWQEFLVPDTAAVIESLDHPYWHFPSITRNKFGKGTLTYEATLVTDTLQREVIRDLLNNVGLSALDQSLPVAVKVRHGRNSRSELLHYYLNYSAVAQSFSYPYRSGLNLLTNESVANGSALHLQPWDLAIVAEH
jgi:beta-galactosidase